MVLVASICYDSVIKLASVQIKQLRKPHLIVVLNLFLELRLLQYTQSSLSTTQILTTLCYRKSLVRSVSVTTSRATETTACCVQDRSKGPACAASASV